jgi:hypothetical protein
MPTDEPPPIPAPVSDSWLQVYDSVNDFRSFAVFRDSKALGIHRGLSLRMMADERVMLMSTPGKDGLGKYHLISMGSNPSPENFAGIVRIHQSGERFTIVSKVEKPFDDREGELAGLALMPSPKGAVLASLSLVLTTDGRPHFAIAKRWDLSRVAVAASKEEPIDPKFTAFRSTVSIGTFDWKSCLGVGEVSVMKSCKNCVISDTNNERIFILCKLGNDWFTVKCKAPISPFVAFGLAVALVESAK